MTDGPDGHVLAEHGTHQRGLLCPGNCRRREVLVAGGALCDDGRSRVWSDGLIWETEVSGGRVGR